MGAKAKSQMQLDDVVVRDALLEQLLEDREIERESTKESSKSFKEVDKKAKAKIESMEQQPPYRVGRFIVSKRPVPARTVEFETQPSTRIKIELTGA